MPCPMPTRSCSANLSALHLLTGDIVYQQRAHAFAERAARRGAARAEPAYRLSGLGAGRHRAAACGPDPRRGRSIGQGGAAPYRAARCRGAMARGGWRRIPLPRRPMASARSRTRRPPICASAHVLAARDRRRGNRRRAARQPRGGQRLGAFPCHAASWTISSSARPRWSRASASFGTGSAWTSRAAASTPTWARTIT